MIIRPTTVKGYEILDVPRLDPVHVYVEDYEPGRGRITIACYGKAWAFVAFWGAMSGRSIIEFFTDCDAGYLFGRLVSGKRLRKSDEVYLLRIIEAVQAAFRELRHES